MELYIATYIYALHVSKVNPCLSKGISCLQPVDPLYVLEAFVVAAAQADFVSFRRSDSFTWGREFMLTEATHCFPNNILSLVRTLRRPKSDTPEKAGISTRSSTPIFSRLTDRTHKGAHRSAGVIARIWEEILALSTSEDLCRG